ncbi:MAG TPA: murein transglycosylase [Rhodobacteraceae bacterium]|nr:murein transglycosylase [Paracoccaceae bacterium]
MRRLLGLAVAAFLVTTGATTGQARAGLAEAGITILSFADLAGWAEDDHAAAFEVFRETCTHLDDGQWRPICTFATAYGGPARTFFELFFRPVLIEDGIDGFFTAYYEPQLWGAQFRTPRFDYPVYRLPPEAAESGTWLTRREIETTGVLADRDLEIAWVDDPVALQFMQIQGSGRIRLMDGTTIRLGYAGSNGQPYRSLGGELVRRGIYDKHQVSEAVIGSWVRRNPAAGRGLLQHNSSYVFFRELDDLPAHRGPRGAMNRSITAQRTLAVDPEFTPLGAPVWLEKRGSLPFNRLMVAQDTGSRIKGAQRADIFIGTGDDAGRRAGRISDPGRMVVLLPIQRAYALDPEG